MRQDKDRTGKWLLTHHADSILRLAGFPTISSWKALQPETVAPRRLADGLIEVRLAGVSEPRLVLVEIESYPDSEVDRQILEDLMLIAVDRKTLPDAISLVLRPKGNLLVLGESTLVSKGGRTQLVATWPVIRLWELEAEELFAANDAGLIPWVPLTKTPLSPDELMARCRDRLATVPDPGDRAGLMAVTSILAGLAFPNRRFLDFFGGAEVAIESPVLDEIKEILRKRYEAEFLQKGMQQGLQQGMQQGLQQGMQQGLQQGMQQAGRNAIVAVLEARFGNVPREQIAALAAVQDESQLRELLRLASVCPDLNAFITGQTTKA